MYVVSHCKTTVRRNMLLTSRCLDKSLRIAHACSLVHLRFFASSRSSPKAFFLNSATPRLMISFTDSSTPCPPRILWIKLSRSLARPPRRSIYDVASPSRSTLTSAAASLLRIYLKDVAASASWRATVASGFVGSAGQSVVFSGRFTLTLLKSYLLLVSSSFPCCHLRL